MGSLASQPARVRIRLFIRQWEMALLQTLDEGWSAKVRADPATKTLGERLGILELLGGLTQLTQADSSLIIARARSTGHCHIDLPPKLLRVIVDVLELTLTRLLFLLVALATQLVPYSRALREQRSEGDALSRG